MTSDEWFEAFLLLQTLEPWLYYGQQQCTYILTWSYTYWSKPTSNAGKFASSLDVRDGESHWEAALEDQVEDQVEKLQQQLANAQMHLGPQQRYTLLKYEQGRYQG